MNISKAKQIFKQDLIGPDELSEIHQQLGIADPLGNATQIPVIPFSEETILEHQGAYLLVLFYPFLKNGGGLSLLSLRHMFGMDPQKREPCFYNQDWYINEDFAKNEAQEAGWFFIRKQIIDQTRGVVPEMQEVVEITDLPSALLLAYTFLANYLLNDNILWRNDFVWCSDFDANGDRIYVARYMDPLGIAKNGFSIHRHLSIKPHYGCI